MGLKFSVLSSIPPYHNVFGQHLTVIYTKHSYIHIEWAQNRWRKTQLTDLKLCSNLFHFTMQLTECQKSKICSNAQALWINIGKYSSNRNYTNWFGFCAHFLVLSEHICVDSMIYFQCIYLSKSIANTMCQYHGFYVSWSLQYIHVR